MAIFEVIKWNAPQDVFAWKYPCESLTTKSQLIVSETQEAILISQGNMVGPFLPGRHTLSSENYPVLNSLLKIPFGGKSPFTAEVWFVQKSYSLEIRWGTTTPIQIEDPKFHILVPIRAFGQYSIQIQDSVKFIMKLVGTSPDFTKKTLSDYFKGIVLKHSVDLLAKYFSERKVSILQASSYVRQISDALMSSITTELASYGLQVVNFSVNSINVDERDPTIARLRRVLAEKAEMEIMGFTYQQKRSFDTMEAAASNQSGAGTMNAAIGLGLGAGIGAPIGNAVSQFGKNLDVGIEQKFCPKCGAKMDMSANFCMNCGFKFNN